MQKGKSTHIIKGMNKDMSAAVMNSEFAFDAKNIRITPIDEGGLIVVTNEKGNIEIPIVNIARENMVIEGNILGTQVLNNYVIIFTHNEDFDRIYRLEKKENTFEGLLLYQGNLNFNNDNPIEGLAVYENEEAQKVYWVDGRNQARVINFVVPEEKRNTWIDTSFDFIPELKLEEEITTSLEYGNGSFHSGMIQYAFTYYNKYGQESNIFYTTSLIPIPTEGQASPEDIIGCFIKIKIYNYDTNFDYIRVYSILRTSIDSTPEIRLVTDINLKSDPYIERDLIDKQLIKLEDIENYSLPGFIEDYYILNGKEKKYLKDYTISSDNNIYITINNYDNFLIVNEKESLYIRPEVQNNTIKIFHQKDSNSEYYNKIFLFENYYKASSIEEKTCMFITDDGNKGSTIDSIELLYKGGEHLIPKTLSQKDNTLFLGNIDLNSNYINDIKVLKILFKQATDKGLKVGEYYNIGLQGQYKNGKWSNVFNKQFIKIDKSNYKYNEGIQNIGFSILNESVEELKKQGIVRLRIVYIPPNLQSRNVLAQGIITPTVFNVANRYNNICYTQPYWRLDSTYIHGKSLLPNTESSIGNVDLPINIQSLVFTKDVSDSSISGVHHPSYYTNQFNIDCNIVNFYSPDIEFENIGSIDLSSYKLNILGCIFFDKEYKALDIQSEEAGTNYAGLKSLSDYPWMDIIDLGSSIGDIVDYALYIWQGKHLNNLPEDKTPGSITFKSTILKNKKFCLYYKYNYVNTYYNNYFNIYDAENCTKDNSVYPIKVLNNNKIYLSNIDSIITTPESDLYSFLYKKDDIVKEAKRLYNDPISMKYKSSNHITISLGDKDSFNILPSLRPTDGSNTSYNSYYKELFCNLDYNDYNLYPIKQPHILIDAYKKNTPFCYIGELIKDTEIRNNVNENTENSVWIPISKPYKFNEFNIFKAMYSNDGDAYLNNYKCLKVCPYNFEDMNSITTIIEFPCISRINLNGIYSKIYNYLGLNLDNFNKINSVYNQHNNYFQYRELSKEDFSIHYFPNTITWTKEKQIGADVDTWTNITMASTLDLDGDKGVITSLNTFNNEIYAFQERGLSNILFNSRVQIPTSDGVPIEISNGYKVQGKRYISNNIGCNNKWSITESPNGIYFIDSDTNSLYLFNGTINSLSDRFGLRGWLGNNNSNKKWNTVTYENFRSFYDRNNGDVYFIKDNDCLCFSELLGQFVSFYDYTKVPSIFNVEGDLFSIKNNKLWKHYSTDNTSIYGEDKEYYITLLSNTEPLKDKIFSNIVCRADGSNNTFFNKLEVWNEYQRGELDLTNIINKPSNLKQKFRTWRVNIPRDNTHKLDRMRNPWLYIKLIGKENSIKLYGTEVEFFM